MNTNQTVYRLEIFGRVFEATSEDAVLAHISNYVSDLLATQSFLTLEFDDKYATHWTVEFEKDMFRPELRRYSDAYWFTLTDPSGKITEEVGYTDFIDKLIYGIRLFCTIEQLTPLPLCEN